MKLSVTSAGIEKIAADLLVLPFTRALLEKDAEKSLKELGFDPGVLKDFKGDAGESVVLYGSGKKIAAQRVALLGLGDGKNLDDWRKASIALGSKALDMQVARLCVDFVQIAVIAESFGYAPLQLSSLFLQGCLAGSYRFDRLKSGKLDKADKKKSSKKTKEIAELILKAGKDIAGLVEKGAAEGMVVGSSRNGARELVNLPGNLLEAEDIAKAAKESGKKHGFDVTVFNRKEIQALGMGGLLSVNKGSFHPPTFTILDYKPRTKAKKVVVLVGKGVTFDSGGISLKPAEGMGEMKSDMSGAACVIGALEAAARLALPVQVIGVIPATDNMPSGTAMKPGDVITTYSGITVEVGNTDAEGRLILADALSYAVEKFKPDVVIDFATLTGACIVALGYSVAGLFSNDDRLAGEIAEAGDLSGEKVWRMPLWDLYAEQIKSDVADVSNTGGRGAGSVTAAKFLEKFIAGHEHWAHIDIAGPAFGTKNTGKTSGGTGFGVGLVVELLKKWS
ncbi:MAG: leucyl aminopeptidase [Chlorobiaceae bacterium]|nr:leucyl aminopeptidase [Chlorobiaceae bacterium]